MYIRIQKHNCRLGVYIAAATTGRPKLWSIAATAMEYVRLSDSRHLVGLAITAICSIIYVCFRLWNPARSNLKFPVVTVRGLPPKQAWLQHGDEVLKHGIQTYGGQPFQVMTGTGPKVVLGNRYADEVSKHKAFSLARSIKPDLFLHYPGFEGVRYSFEPQNEKTLPAMIRQHLTQSLGMVTKDLVEEATESIHEIFGESKDWRDTIIKEDVLDMVARLSTRVLSGQPLCSDPRWLNIVKNYAMDAFFASHEMRTMKSLLRPVLFWFSEPCKRLRRQYRDAKALVHDEVARRASEAENVLSAGGDLRKKSDSIAWLVESNPGRTLSTTELVAAQLGLAVASVQTTSEATSQAICHLCEFPQYIAPLRAEAAGVLRDHGWARTSLYQMKLMDSFLKESQRFIKGCQGLGRMATEDVTLSDGLFLPKGTRVVIEATFWDAEIYGSNVAEFDAYRFMRKREQPGQANGWQYVSVTPDFMGFGLGEHSCPGEH